MTLDGTCRLSKVVDIEQLEAEQRSTSSDLTGHLPHPGHLRSPARLPKNYHCRQLNTFPIRVMVIE